MPRRTLIVIPAYNEAASIEAVLGELREKVPGVDRLVVTDGSTDGTQKIVERMGEAHLALATNLGYGRALQAGFRYALEGGYDVVVSFDADGQHRAEDVPRLLAALRDTGADVVIGCRFNGGRGYQGPLGRRLGQRILSHLTRLVLGQRVYDTTSGLKATRARACRLLLRGTFLDFHVEALVRLGLMGLRIHEIPVTVRHRRHGRSMHSWTSAFEYPLKTLLLTLVAVVDAYIKGPGNGVHGRGRARGARRWPEG